MKRIVSALVLTLTIAACSRSSDIPVNDFASLVQNLQDAGFTVASDPAPLEGLYPFFTESRILLEGEPLEVYTFDTPEQAAYGVKMISADGTMVDGKAVNRLDPVFYRKENLIVLSVHSAAEENAYLKTLLGEPVFPRAAQASSVSSSTSS